MATLTLRLRFRSLVAILAPMNGFDIIRETIGSLRGKRIIDIGCGKGGLAAALGAAGAIVTGIDPSADALDAARKTAPGATFEQSGAENLPFPNDAFDAAIFSNSLHHVPEKGMVSAIAEARRVTRSGGHLIVIEPLTTGSFDAVLKLINDETVVRAFAQHVVDDLKADASLTQIASRRFTVQESFADFDAFIVRATSADPRRLDIIARDRVMIEAAFHEHASPSERNALKQSASRLDHDMKADAFVLQ